MTWIDLLVSSVLNNSAEFVLSILSIFNVRFSRLFIEREELRRPAESGYMSTEDFVEYISVAAAWLITPIPAEISWVRYAIAAPSSGEAIARMLVVVCLLIVHGGGVLCLSVYKARGFAQLGAFVAKLVCFVPIAFLVAKIIADCRM